MLKIQKNKAIFWDYDTKKMDLNDPRVKTWFIKRKLDFGDLAGLKIKDLKLFLPALDIDPSLKNLLTNYLKQHG